MNPLKSKSWILILFPIICLLACETNNIENPDGYIYQIPEQLDDGWQVSSLSAQGMDIEIISNLTQDIQDGLHRGIHSLMIVKNGILVHEVYFGGYQREDLQIIFSITKSISSALIGIAIEGGLIQSVEASVLSFFPQYDIKDQNKQKIKLRHLLTLTSGWEWDEKSAPYSDPQNTEYQMRQTNDWMKFVLERPMQNEPGSEWVYNTGSVHLLSGIINQVSGMRADVFAEQVLFDPLGIRIYEWNTDPQGHPCTGGTLQGLRLRTRDTAKFGFLFLNNGRWNGQQVVSESWLEESTRKHFEVNADRDMGYLWWRGSFKLEGEEIPHFYAAGYGGQTIHIVPQFDLMIVLTCWHEAQDADIAVPILTIYAAVL